MKKYLRIYKIWILSWGGFLKNDASPSGFGHWFRDLDSLENNIKNKLTFDIYALTSKSKFGAEFVATITDFGDVAKQKVF